MRTAWIIATLQLFLINQAVSSPNSMHLAIFQDGGVLYANQDRIEFPVQLGPPVSCQPAAGDRAEVLKIEEAGPLRLVQIRMIDGRCAGGRGVSKPISLRPIE